MAHDVSSILCLAFAYSIILSSNSIVARPQRHDFEFSVHEGRNCSSLDRKSEGDWSFEEGRGINRYVDEENTGYNETDNFAARSRASFFGNEGRGFSFVDIVESMFSAVANGIGSIMTSIIGPEKNSKSRSSRVSYKNYQLIRLFPSSTSQANELKELRDAEPDDIRFWTQPAYNKSTDVLVAPDLISDLKTFLKDRGIDFKLLIPDLQKIIAYQNPKMSKEQREDLVTSQGHGMTWKRYHRYGDIVGYLEYLAFRYSKLVELITIGHSYEGQPIKMVKISTGPNKDGEPKPAIWIDAGMHAREWIGSAVATYIASQLVERNASYAKLLDNSDWMILPVANPDGYEFTHTGDRLWRKTRSNHGENQDDSRYLHSSLLQFVNHYAKWFWGNCEGVDPNRNFGYHWGELDEGGASSDPCHETYAGPHPFSEPETKAMADYILANKQNIRMYLTLHSYSQMWLVPWGYTYSKPSDYSELANVAKKAINAIAKIHGTDYQLGPSSDLLYPTSGASDDWAKGVAGIKYAYTLELRDRGTYGFLLPATQIMPTAREIWAGIRTIARLVTCNT
ncbi:PREDICTED: carboxypeptidase B-like [Dufourea novaeangliae]|uniref:carboxypeptidase B-like n=1 Tax=Dufourea novaeangliae TaxID=178035 RepID=UPI000767C806|nr:PREDICTED: carboxypeptidase B-like [Dufourea novaeangliae]